MKASAKIAFVIIALIGTPVFGAKLSGKVVVTKALREAVSESQTAKVKEKRAYYWNQPNGIIPVRPVPIDLSSDIAVVIEEKGAGPAEPDKLTTTKVLAGALERNVIAVRPRSTIRFQVVDPFDHELYCPTLPEFKPELQSTGAYRPIEFANEGVFEVRCKRMPNFRGYVVVTGAKVVLDVQKDGTFAVDDLSPGNYVLKVFHNGSWIHRQEFEIQQGSRRGPQLEVKLTAKPTAAKPTTKKEANDEAKPEDTAKTP